MVVPTEYKYIVRQDHNPKLKRYFKTFEDCEIWLHKLFKRRIETTVVRLSDNIIIGEIYSTQKIKIHKWHWWLDKNIKGTD